MREPVGQQEQIRSSARGAYAGKAQAPIKLIVRLRRLHPCIARHAWQQRRVYSGRARNRFVDYADSLRRDAANSNLVAERAGLPTFRVEHKAIPKSIPDVEAQQRLKGD